MDINNKPHSQFELFPDSNVKKNVGSVQQGNFFRGFTFTPENIITSIIIIIVSFVVLFSFGVERGKRVAKMTSNSKNGAIEKKAVQINGNSVSLPPSDEGKVSENTEIEKVEFASVGQRIIGNNEAILSLPQEVQETNQNVFTIQVASFKQKKNAQMESEKLNGMGEDVFVLSKGDHLIVCIGRFKKREEAKTFSNKIKSRYNDFLIRRL
ncbi:MAG: SPOR domain-containing protein [Candidatus Omnitrophica bacterium]|nr:SPOR domain-containing protein [Candidatus Omnitrophota bacterium]MBU1996316.1 SPOR domain-containing protein [Candidatus Omnitrophota bacterium]MBU4334405.1 SPOR domain-containing protein [Candidatus Omnitrophota bacterium]